MNLDDLQRRLRDFADERDWDAFHSPKNLSMALSVEAVMARTMSRTFTSALSPPQVPTRTSVFAS